MGDLSRARHHEEPAGQAAVVDVVLEVATDAGEAPHVEACLCRIDLDLDFHAASMFV
jgi:hypothetical protein